MAGHERTNQPDGLIIAEPITSKDLMGGSVAVRADADGQCLDLSDIPVQFASVVDPVSGDTTYIGVPTKPLVGDDLNRLLYTIAPAKYFDLDLGDIRMDWTDIVADTPEGERLRALHEELVGTEPWERVMGEREALLTHMDRGSGHHGYQNPVIPVMQWTVTADGRRAWGHEVSYDLLRASLADQLGIRAVAADRGGIYHPMTGLAVVALFSPTVTEDWPEDVEGQPMGPTQVLGQVVMHEQELLSSPYIEAAERYVQAAAA